MGRLAWVVLVLAATPLGCAETFPDRVALQPEARNVEVVTDVPNEDVYESVGAVSAQVVARDSGEAFHEATNALRNQAAKRGATFVSIEEVTSHAARDFSGRTVVSMAGTAFKPKL